MSEQVTVKGKLTKIETNLSIEEFAKRFLNDNGFNDLGDYCSWEDILSEEFCDQFVRINGGLYSAEIEETDEPDFFEIREENGTHHFHTSYYTGGTCWRELVEDHFKELAASKIKNEYND